MRRWAPGLALLLLLAACAGAGQPGEAGTAAADAVTEVAPTPTPPPPFPSATPLLAATMTPAQVPNVVSTTAPSPMATPTATPMATPTATPTAAPHAPDVLQPAYAASACSDRFPCNEDVAAWEARIEVPPGFEVRYLAQFPQSDPAADWPSLQPTSLTTGPDGRVYVAFRQGSIYAIDAAGQATRLFEGLTVPTGLAFQPGTRRLFVSNRVLDRNVGGEGEILAIENGQAVQLVGGLPCCYLGMHGPNGIAFGPDGYGYVGIGGRADHGEVLDGLNTQDRLHPWEAAVLRFSPDGRERTVFARGLRNPYDIAWDAGGTLYATDNGRDEDPSVGESVPDELHAVVPGGEHGYPYYECPRCFGIPETVNIVPPLVAFTPHSVPTGITAYLDDSFPGYYNSMFVTLWTALPFAARVMRVTPDGQASTFATGFAAPVDVAVGPVGQLLVADYATGIIFEIRYRGAE